MKKESFQFQQFTIRQDQCAMKVGTDGVMLGAWANGGKRILDIGAGTGLLCLMMAQRYPEAFIDGIEVDERAAMQARENIATSPFAHRIRITADSIQNYTKMKSPTKGHLFYDAIISNPPYFLNSLKNPDKNKQTARHADSLPYRDLCLAVKTLLSDHGAFSVVIPTGDCTRKIMEEASIQGLFLRRGTNIKTTEKKIAKRCLLEFTKYRPTVLVQEEQVLQTENGLRSEWYANITKDFYL